MLSLALFFLFLYRLEVRSVLTFWIYRPNTNELLESGVDTGSVPALAEFELLQMHLPIESRVGLRHGSLEGV